MEHAQKATSAKRFPFPLQLVVLGALVLLGTALAFLYRPAVPAMNTLRNVPLTKSERAAQQSAFPFAKTPYKFAYRVDDSVKSVCVYIECWRGGSLERTLGMAADDLKQREGGILIAPYDLAAGAMAGIGWSIADGGGGCSMDAALPGDIVANARGVTTLFEQGASKSLSIAKDSPVILTAAVFNGDTRLLSFDCKSLMAEPTKLRAYDYAFLLKAMFSEKDATALMDGLRYPPGGARTQGAVVFMQGGKAVKTVAFSQGDTCAKTVDNAITDSLLRSAAWPALDMAAFPDRIDIQRYVGAQEEPAYHVFLRDGKPCMQGGTGMWTYISEASYYALCTVGPMQASPAPSSPASLSAG